MNDRAILYLMLGMLGLWLAFGGACYYFGYHSAASAARTEAFYQAAREAAAARALESRERASWAASSAGLKAGLAQDEAALQQAQKALAAAHVPAGGCQIPRGAIHALNLQRRRS